MKKFIVCYDDENHYRNIWFDGEYIGSTEDLGDLLITMYNYGIDEHGFSICDLEYIEINIDVDVATEEDFDTLHNYLCFPKQIDKQVWAYFCDRNFQKAVEKIRELT